MNAYEAIKELELSGQPVCIHSSLGSFGCRVEGLLETFLDAGCTVLVPTFSDMFEAMPVPEYMPPQNGAGDYSYFYEKEYADVGIYNPGRNEYSREDMGAFPGLVLARPDRVRGGNHLNSFAAVGLLARELAACQTNGDVYAPLKKLYELNGFVLLMGTGLDTATAIHYAEEKAERYPFVRWSKDGSGKTIPVRAGGCSEGFPKLDAVLAPYEKQAQVEKSLWRSYRIRDLVDTAEKAFRENPLVTHCGDSDCARCNDSIKGGPKW